MTNTPAPMTLAAMFGTYPNTAALKNRDVRSALVEFEFADVKVANTAFKAVVREQKYDLSELAIVTYLQARVFGKPYALLPATILGRSQHHTIFYNAERGQLGPRDLTGRRVGVRAYTQTTGAWVRGILAEDYGVDLDRVRWITFEDPHLAEYRDPPKVERAPAGKVLAEMLLDGEIDAAILGDVTPDPRLKPLIPDAEAVARRWAERHGGVPINHMAVMREGIVKSRPDVVREVFRLLRESKDRGPGKDPDAIRFGVEANRRSLEIIIDYAQRQQLIPRRFTVDELFDDTTRALGI
ncbi:MAG TPA: ABC transporter substrate-binding protein [Stellaceae bacterium]|nr:ABC transporter substrate-binding protein [Stellaceae bacterium]